MDFSNFFFIFLVKNSRFANMEKLFHFIGPSAVRPFSYRANVAVVTRDVCKYRRTDRSLGAVAGRLAVSSVGALHVTRQARRDPAWHALNDAIRLASGSSSLHSRSPHLDKNADRVTRVRTGRCPKQSDLKEKSNCLS